MAQKHTQESETARKVRQLDRYFDGGVICDDNAFMGTQCAIMYKYK